MKLSKAKMMREAERFLKRTADYQEDRDVDKAENYKIQYVLSEDGRMQPETVIACAYSEYREQEISFYPFRKEETVSYNWAVDFDYDLFETLEHGGEIIGMTLNCHYCIWTAIENFHDGDIEYDKGMQKYLAYCKRNGVTKELLQEKVSYDGMDVMELYVKEVPGKQKREQER